MELLYLLLLIEFGLLLIVTVTTTFDFISPSFITLTMFTISTVCVIFNSGSWNIDFKITTFGIIAIGLTVMVLVELSVKNYYKKSSFYNYDGFKVVSSEPAWVRGYILKDIILVSSILMMFIYVREVHNIGQNLSLNNMISEIGAVKASELHTSTIATLCLRIGYALSNLYAFIFCHNIIISKQKLKKNAYLLISAVCGVIASFYSGSRGMLMGSIIAFLFYFIIFMRISKGWKEIKIKKYLKYIIPIIIIFIAFFYFSRNAVKNREYTSGPIEYISYYLGNSQQLLNLSINNGNKAFPNIYNLPGVYTFQFLYNELSGFGIVSLPEKISSRFLRLNSFTQGNVYTMFGEPYHDFGFIGMLLYIAIFYWIFSYFYYKYIRNWKNTKKSKGVFLILGTQYYLIFFTFYLAPTIWLKIQTIITIFIILLVFKIIKRYRITLGRR